MAKSLVKLLATVEPLIASSLIVCMCVCQNAYVIHIRLASNDKSIIYFLYLPIYRTYTPFTWMPGAGTSRSARPAPTHTEEESESPIGQLLTGTTTQPSTSVVPTGGTTTQETSIKLEK